LARSPVLHSFPTRRSSDLGCVMMQRIDDRTCEMKRMFISPEGRGLGLGRRLAESIVRVAAERGYAIMRLDTGRNHDEALGLYRSDRKSTRLNSSHVKISYA